MTRTSYFRNGTFAALLIVLFFFASAVALRTCGAQTPSPKGKSFFAWDPVDIHAD